MTSSTNLNLLELVPFARQLSEANEVLLERELVLRQLSLFQNLAELLKASRNSFEQIFKINWKSLPGLNSTECIVITIENLSEIFEFNEKFWSISTSFSNGNVHVWNFGKLFKQREVEKLSVHYQPQFQSCLGHPLAVKEKIDINLVFAMQWTGVNYVRNFIIKSFSVDILHFVNPARRPPPHFPISLSPYQTGKLKEEFKNKYPAISKFSVRIDERLQDIFVEKIFLRDSFLSRGFVRDELRSDFTSSKEFHAYYYDDKIICSKETKNMVSFHCTNAKVLHMVKDAVYMRLLDLCESKVVRIKCADVEENGDILYQIKLQLESMVVDPDIEFPQLLEIYLKFREMSESVLSFVYNENVNIMKNS